MEASEAANRDNKGRFSTPDKNRKDKTAGRKRGRHGKWSTKKNTTNRENNTKTGRSNTIDLTDTKEDIHCTERAESYDAETDDEPSTTTRTDISTIEKTVESLRKLVEKQGAKIAALENALEKLTACDETDTENKKTGAYDSEDEESDCARRLRHPEIIYSKSSAGGRYKEKDIRRFSAKKIKSYEEWKVSYGPDETEKEDRKQLSTSDANLHHDTPDDDFEEDYVYFSHKKWDSFEIWEADYDSNEEMHNTK